MRFIERKTVIDFLVRYRWLLYLLTAYLFVTLSLAYTLYNHFRIDTRDFATFAQALWTTVHGGWFENSLEGMSHFGVHNSPIFFLLLPLCLLIPPQHVLIWITPLVIGAAAVCLYVLVRRHLEDEVAAHLAAALFMFMPCVFVRNLCNFYENVLALPFVFLCFLFFEQNRFQRFMVTFFLALLAKENVALTMVLFAPYALLRRKTLRWVIIPLLLCVGWFVLSVWVVIPAFSAWGRYGVPEHYFGHLGETPFEIAGRLITDPGVFLSLATERSKLWYLYYTFGQFLFLLPLVCLETIFLLPTLFFVLITTNTRFTYFIMHPSLLLSAFLCVCLIYSGRNLARHVSAQGRRAFMRLFLAAALLAVLGLYPRWMRLKAFRPRERQVAIVDALAHVPNGASVKVPMRLTPYLCNRWDLRVSEMEGLDVDVIILDMEPSRDSLLAGYEKEPTKQDFRQLSEGSSHECIFFKDGIAVFLKKDFGRES